MANEPKIEISEVNPGEAPLQRAAAELAPGLRFRLHVKGVRADVIEAVKSARDIPVEDQDYILRRIAAIPEEHGVLQVSAIGVPHKAGFNFSFTACELT